MSPDFWVERIVMFSCKSCLHLSMNNFFQLSPDPYYIFRPHRIYTHHTGPLLAFMMYVNTVTPTHSLIFSLATQCILLTGNKLTKDGFGVVKLNAFWHKLQQ